MAAAAAAGGGRITRALVSAASRRTALDSSVLPKALLDIEGEALICHVLRQLHRGGVLHVVLVLRYQSAEIIAEVERFIKGYQSLQVEVLDLGQAWEGFYAKSLLAAWPSCRLEEADSPGILVATADHIFDETLVRDMCRARLEPQRTEASVLTDFVQEPLSGLPQTTVGVRAEGGRVLEVSQALGRPAVAGAPGRPGVGVEAGLFACGRALFQELEALERAQEYFTLTDAVQRLATLGLVASVETAGRRWVAVETLEELDCTRRSGLPARRPSESPSAGSGAGDTPAFLHEPVPVFFVAGGHDRRTG